MGGIGVPPLKAAFIMAGHISLIELSLGVTHNSLETGKQSRNTNRQPGAQLTVSAKQILFIYFSF